MAVILALGAGVLAPGPASAAEGTSKHVPLPPARILDTRSGVGAPAGSMGVGTSLNLQVGGRGGVPGSGVTAVTLNVTLTASRAAGYVQALPSGAGTLGASSNLNATGAGQTVANLVTVPVGAGGAVTMYNVAGGHLIADVLGYYTETPLSTDGRYVGVTPTRLLDSRDRTGLPPVGGLSNPGDAVNCGNFTQWADANAWFWRYYPAYGDVAQLDGNDDLVPCESLPGAPRHPVIPPTAPAENPFPKVHAGEAVTLQVAGRAGVPASGASAVALTVTATQSSGTGFVQVVPTGGPTSLGSTSNLNLTSAGQTVANLVVVPLAADGTVQLYSSSGTHLIADVVGWFTDARAAAASEGLFVPITPARLTDTRTGPKVSARGQLALSPLGVPGVPASGAAGVMVNLTATATEGPGYLQTYPTGKGTPGASSSLNYTGAGETVATANLASLGGDRTFTLYTSTTTHVVIDVFGYLTGPALDVASPVAGALLGELVVAAPNTSVPYDRAEWEHWVDDDGDCQDTRAEVLIAESLTPPVLDASGCTVVAGTWHDSYGSTSWTMPSDVDIDHTVALQNAHVSGGWAWDAATKRAYANDQTFAGHLTVMEDGLNQAKGSAAPDTWKPIAADSRCQYATDWATIKTTWSLTVTSAELQALTEMLATC